MESSFSFSSCGNWSPVDTDGPAGVAGIGIDRTGSDCGAVLVKFGKIGSEETGCGDDGVAGKLGDSLPGCVVSSSGEVGSVKSHEGRDVSDGHLLVLKLIIILS